MHEYWTATIALLCVLAQPAYALPLDASAEGADDDATVRLVVDAQTLSADRRSRCTVSLEVAQAEVAFTPGDRVFVWVYEDDAFANDQIWATDFAVQPADWAAGRLQRTFDCTSDFGADGVGGIEVFAEARIEKAACGFLCVWDRPATPALALETVDDDPAEDDDNADGARALALGLTGDRVAREQDWTRIELERRSRITVRVDHRPGAGRLDLVLLDEGGAVRAQAVDTDDGAVVDFEPADPGRWLARVSPRDGTDPNFYDLRLRVDTLAGECVDGQVETEFCGQCGTRERQCDENGRFTPFGACEGEGECAPGSMRRDACGRCGTLTVACGDDCAWAPQGGCVGEGECEPGAEDESACDEGGTRLRGCDDACRWGPYGECAGAECEAGTVRECYSGVPETRGLGACRPGRQSCVGGRWGACVDEVVPRVERCDDGLDDDCDGTADEADLDCAEAPRVGDPCSMDDDCGDALECLRGPENPLFIGGYCGVVPCAGPCGDATACVRAFGRQTCLARCGEDRDCRPGYRCLALEPSQTVCAPPCGEDTDCGDPRRPVCDLASGLCVETVAEPPAPADPDVGVGPPGPPVTQADAGSPNPTPIDAEPPTAEAGCACRGVATSTRVDVVHLSLCLAASAFAARRRRKR